MRGKEVLMIKGARKIVDTCARISKGENVLIITDPERLNISKLLMSVCYEKGIEPVISVMYPNELDGEEPHEIIASSMSKADVIIMPVARSISHSNAVHDALDNGTRVLALSAWEEEMLYTGGIHADFDEHKNRCERFGEYLTQASEVKITSSRGTDFSASIEGREGNSHSCIVAEAGEYSSVPNIEANISPVEGTSEGIIVADASVPNFGIGVLDNPIEFKIEGGLVKSINGGSEAEFLRGLLEDLDDQAALNIAQIAIGLNPLIENFNGLMNNDHGVFGSMHIGIGTSHNLGGDVKAPVHYDVLMSDPTLRLDGEKVINEGKIMK